MGFFPVPLAQRNAQFAADLELKQQQALQDQQDARAAALLKQQVGDFGRAAAARNMNAPDIGALVQTAKADPARASAMLAQWDAQKSPQGLAGLANTQADTAGRQQSTAFDAALQPGRVTGQRLQNAIGQQTLNTAQEPPAPLSMGQRLKQAFEADTGATIPSGMRPQIRTTPDGRNFVDVQPMEGTPAYQDAMKGQQELHAAMQENERFRDLLATHGTEAWNKEAVNKLNESRSLIVSHYGNAMMKMGVLQPTDLARVDAGLPNPTDWGNQLNTNAANNIMAAYDQLGTQMEEELGRDRQRNWFLPRVPITPAEQASAHKARLKANGR
jgi:hypothetical protein